MYIPSWHQGYASWGPFSSLDDEGNSASLYPSVPPALVGKGKIGLALEVINHSNIANLSATTTGSQGWTTESLSLRLFGHRRHFRCKFTHNEINTNSSSKLNALFAGNILTYFSFSITKNFFKTYFIHSIDKWFCLCVTLFVLKVVLFMCYLVCP